MKKRGDENKFVDSETGLMPRENRDWSGFGEINELKLNGWNECDIMLEGLMRLKRCSPLFSSFVLCFNSVFNSNILYKRKKLFGCDVIDVLVPNQEQERRRGYRKVRKEGQGLRSF